MKALGCPAASKCEATVGGRSDAVPATKSIANRTSRTNMDQVTRCGYLAGGADFMARATAPGRADDSSALPPAIPRASREIQATCANDAARASCRRRETARRKHG